MKTLHGVCVLLAALAQAVDPDPTCTKPLVGECLKDSEPILQELTNQTVSSCCTACVALPACISWTLNTVQKQCHLRAVFTGHLTKGTSCTSGLARPQPPTPAPQPRPTPAPTPLAPTPAPVPPPAGAKNVLFILVDDLRPQLGAYNISVCGGGGAAKIPMHTPSIDRMAARGLTFLNHYTQYAVCSPSRNSFMSGRRPDTTLTYNFKDDFRTTPAGGNTWLPLPEYFKSHGYNVTGMGKTYHANRPKNFDEPRSWTEGVPYVGYNQGLGFCGEHAACALAANDTAHFTDDGIAARAVEIMASHKANGVGPWLVMAGFIRPHVDWSAPQRFWDLYPEDQCGADTVAVHKTAPPSAPKIAWVDGGYVDGKTADLPKGYKFSPTAPVNDALAAHWRRGYYAAVSYMDWNVGKLLDALDDLGLADDTIVALMADHGYQLGEHSMWEKYTNWELAARVPFIIAAPHKAATHGRATTALTENVDAYPTVAALAGLPLPAIECAGCVEGDDASPLLDDPTLAWKKGSISQYARCSLDNATGLYQRCSGDSLHTTAFQTMGYSVRSAGWRYTEWFSFGLGHGGGTDFNASLFVELYDHRDDEGDDFDAYDQVNVATDPANAVVVKEHAQMVRDGWTKLRPHPSSRVPRPARRAAAPSES